jgi:micrococcal nuclease
MAASETDPVYRYRAEVIRVIDGDTFVARVDLGFGVRIDITVRVRDYNAPELRAPGGAEAKARAVDVLGKTRFIVTLQTYKDQQTFARWVAHVWVGGVPYPVAMAVPASVVG